MEFSFWQEYQDDGVTVIGISNQPISVIEDFIEDQGVTFPVLRDQGGAVYSSYNLPGGQSPYPRDFIIDQTRFIHFADNEYDPGTMITVIENLIGETTNVTHDVPLPKSLSISSIYPNPFNPTVTIEINIQKDQAIELDVFDVNGRWVDTIFAGWLISGDHSFKWSSRNGILSSAGSGIYLVTLKGEHQRISKKIVLLK
ncbi:MAG: redoxin domain-containing protein [Candidatus Marinimicrobia bacterium]|nr:redoxin domain-containing protein [Candidatus Neomarinimicrobiota bacterium]